jgi:hypothetical protein
LAKGPDAISAAGEDFMRISLMPDVPDQAVPRSVEDVVERHGEFHHAEAGTEMPARNGYGIDGLSAKFLGNLREKVLLEPAQILRGVQTIEEGSWEGQLTTTSSEPSGSRCAGHLQLGRAPDEVKIVMNIDDRNC